MHSPLNIGSAKQLFIDDYCVAELSGVRRQLNQPTKHPGNPLLVREMPWEEQYVNLYGSVLFDPDLGHFRMWYSARDGRGANTICHATSFDGIRWERSRLDLFPFGDSKLTNIVLSGHYVGPTVFRTPQDPDPQRRYRMFVFMGPELLTDPSRPTSFENGYGVLFSPDGLQWTEYPNNPVIQGGDIATCCYDPVSQEYIAFPKIYKSEAGVGRRCVGRSTSKDFLHWSTPSLVLSADTQDDAGVAQRLNRFSNLICYDDPGYHSSDIYGMTGFCYEGLRLGLMWFYDRSGLRPPRHGGNDDGVMNVQLAYQRGGHWQRAGSRENFLSCGDEGDYDSCQIKTAHAVIETEDELWFYYGARDRSHGFDNLHPGRPLPLTKTPLRGPSINLASLRRDGFVSIDALHPAGMLITKPLVFTGTNLEINADAERGKIVVALLDPSDNPIPGFTREDCIPFRLDAVRGRIAWKNGGSLEALQGKPVRVVFELQTAKLYAFRFCQ